MLAMLLEDQINWQDNVGARIGNRKKRRRKKVGDGGITVVKQRT